MKGLSEFLQRWHLGINESTIGTGKADGQAHREFAGRRMPAPGLCGLAFLFSLFGLAATPPAQGQVARTIVFDSNQTGHSEIYLQNLSSSNAPIGTPFQLTDVGSLEQDAQEPQFSLVASVNATTNPDSLGRIVYQFGVSGARGLHLIRPTGTFDVQLTPEPLNGSITGGPLQGKPYPCTDARDPSWSPTGSTLFTPVLKRQETLQTPTNMIFGFMTPTVRPTIQRTMPIIRCWYSTAHSRCGRRGRPTAQ